MAKHQSSQIKIAILVIATIVLAVFGFNFLKNKSLFSKKVTYHATFDSAKGLTASNKVFLLGVEIGKVDDIQFSDDFKQVNVSFFLDKGLQLPKDSKVSINPGLPGFGSPALVVQRGQSNQMLSPNSMVASENPSGIMDQATGIMNSVEPTLENASMALKRFDSVAMGLNKLIGGENGQKLEYTIASLEATSRNFNQSSKKINQLLETSSPKIESMLQNFESISSNLKNNEERINAAIANFSKTSENLATLDLKNTLNNANQAINELNSTLKKVNSGDGSLALLLNDAELYNNLNNAARDLDRLILDLKENPSEYVPDVSVFGKKNKNK